MNVMLPPPPPPPSFYFRLFQQSHAGQIFCCVAALSIGNGLDKVDRNQLGWWLSERQCDSGGLNGRPEKQADVCYSWWVLSVLAILGRLDWIDRRCVVFVVLFVLFVLLRALYHFFTDEFLLLFVCLFVCL